MLQYKIGELSENELIKYFSENDDIFMPSLSSRLDISKYSAKLKEYATHFCVFDDGRLVGLVAAYFNDNKNHIGYISSASIAIKYQKSGLMKNLLMMTINYARENKFRSIILEVRNENLSVTHVYEQAGFVKMSSRDNSIIMAVNM